MSDDDRLADYLARMDDSGYTRTLTDGCAGCGESLVSCNCSLYIDREPCCQICTHKAIATDDMRRAVLDDFRRTHGLDLSDDDRADRVRTNTAHTHPAKP